MDESLRSWSKDLAVQQIWAADGFDIRVRRPRPGGELREGDFGTREFDQRGVNERTDCRCT